MHEFTREQWDRLKDLLSGDDEPVQLRDDYSGRAMFGAKCVAVVGGTKQLLQFWSAMHELLMEEEFGLTELLDVLRTMQDAVRQDSMASEVIYYFPGVTVAE